MVTFCVLGLNCGTSVDGVDVAHCRISSVSGSGDVTIEVLSYSEVAVDPVIRTQVLRVCRPNQASAATTMAEVCDLNFALGREFARAIEASGVNLDEVDVVASHGQTLWHQPLGAHRSTLQMAEPAVLAQRTQRQATVVSNFRVAELAAGRQGAPLSGFFEAALLSDPGAARIIQNVGGMGNASVLLGAAKAASTGDASSYFAFDTGPGNVFIDAAMRILTDGRQHFDRDGMRGAAGEAQIDEDFVHAYLAEEAYFQQPPPKTTGRELFSDDVAQRLVSALQARGASPDAIIATITRITAESIARAYDDYAIPLLRPGAHLDEIYICGGGAYNPNILRHLQARFPKTRVARLDDAPTRLDPGAKEAVLFALLGFLGLCGRTVPLATDAESLTPAILGVVTPGNNYRDLLRRVVNDADFAHGRVLGRVTVVEPGANTSENKDAPIV